METQLHDFINATKLIEYFEIIFVRVTQKKFVMPETTEYSRLGDGGNQSLFSRWQYLTRLEKGLILICTVFGIVIFSLAIALAKCDAQVPPPSPNVTTVAPETTTAPPSTTTVPPSTTTVPSSTTTVTPTTTTSTTTVTPTTTTSTTTVTPTTTTSTTTVPPTTTTSTIVPPSITTSTTTATTKKNPSNEIENTRPENIKKSSTESATSPFVSTSQDAATELLKNIPPIPLTGIKQISLQEVDTLTTKNPYEETTAMKNFENATEKQHPVLSRKKRIDMSSTAEGKKDNPIYE